VCVGFASLVDVVYLHARGRIRIPHLVSLNLLRAAKHHLMHKAIVGRFIVQKWPQNPDGRSFGFLVLYHYLSYVDDSCVSE
jgi:hypothetical protein